MTRGRNAGAGPECRLIWQVRRRPPANYLAGMVLVATLLGIGSTLLTRMLMLRPDWAWPLAVGVGITALFMTFAARGAVTTVDERGILAYGFGSEPALEVDMRRIRRLERVRAGLLTGIGAEVDPAAVVFLRRRGMSYRSLREHERKLGLALMLEFLDDSDLAALRALHAGYSQS